MIKSTSFYAISFLPGVIKKMSLLLMAVSFLSLVTAPTALALTEAQKHVIDSGPRYFNTEVTNFAACQSDYGGSGNLSGNDNEERVWNFLTSNAGFTPPQAAGIMGNMQAEAHFEPRLVEYGWKNSRGEVSKPGQESSLDDNVPPDQGPQGQPGYGIVQWTSPNRKQGLRDLTQSRGVMGGDLGAQLDYLMQELQGPYKNSTYDPIRATDSLDEASDIFMTKFERPKDQSEPAKEKRRQMGREILARHGSGESGSGSQTGSYSSCGQAAGSVCKGNAGSPLSQSTAIQWFNSSSHGSSVSYPDSKPDHSTIMSPSRAFGAQSVSNSEHSNGEAADVGVDSGTKVFAPTDGNVVYSGVSHGGGTAAQTVVIESTDRNCVSLVANVDSLVNNGAVVKAGDEIGVISYAILNPHLHFELWVDGIPINIGKDSDKCRSSGNPDCASFSDKAEQIWNQQVNALSGGSTPGH